MKELINVIDETLRIINTGGYSILSSESTSEGKVRHKTLQLNKVQMSEAIVITEKQVQELIASPKCGGRGAIVRLGHRCGFAVSNTDSFSAAKSIISGRDSQAVMQNNDSSKKEKNKVLVLNFASPVNPGGGVRRGAKAQEEDLCRKSTLLASLESKAAAEMYSYNRARSRVTSSDYMILSPNVEVFRNMDNSLLKKTYKVSVLTAAAPDISRGLDGVSTEALEKVFYQRIMGILSVAMAYGYRHLVLGAWGCGAFGNDADVVARLFYKALKDIRFDGLNLNVLFDYIEFAVLTGPKDRYNYECFKKCFSDFFHDEDIANEQKTLQRKRENEKWLDQIRGCLIGGAAGDALGYPVEFISFNDIVKYYTETGITDYKIDMDTGKALITDDTQMTLFTANGILYGITRSAIRGISGSAESYIYAAYLDWLATQTGKLSKVKVSWLTEVEALHNKRAPGLTCLRALRSGDMGSIDGPINDSKGCGGIMRVAPVALYYGRFGPCALDGAKAAAITHSHPLGYMPAAALVHIIARIVFGGCPNGDSIRDIVDDSIVTITELFPDNAYLDDLTGIIKLAITLSQNDEADELNISKIGRGWVAEEALGIALYCSLKYYDDFSAAIVAAVNHDGDSDSTGAITGNIVGAHIGYSNIPQKWKDNLELYDVILEISDDLCHDCLISEYDTYIDDEWEKKYIYCKSVDKKQYP